MESQSLHEMGDREIPAVLCQIEETFEAWTTLSSPYGGKQPPPLGFDDKYKQWLQGTGYAQKG